MKPYATINDIKRSLTSTHPEEYIAHVDGKEETAQISSCCKNIPKFLGYYPIGEMYLICDQCIKKPLWKKGLKDIVGTKLK